MKVMLELSTLCIISDIDIETFVDDLALCLTSVVTGHQLSTIPCRFSK